MGLNDTFDFYRYHSDDGSNYAVKLSTLIAAAGGFTTIVDPLTEGSWAFGARNLRHIYGVVSATGKRAKIPIQDNGNALYQSGGSFSLHGATYVVAGAIGEARKLNFIA